MQPMLQRRVQAPRALPWLVLAAHVLVLLLVGHALRPRERDAATAARPLWLRLLPETSPPAADPARTAPARPPRPAARPPYPSVPPRAEPAAPAAAPGPRADAITLPAPEAPAAAPPPQPPASTPLDLRLAPPLRHAPPPAAALARDDPRANSSRIGSEDRMARTLGTDLTLRESVDPDGTRTFRRGRDCVVARPARDSQINPFDQGSRPTPRLVEKCSAGPARGHHQPSIRLRAPPARRAGRTTRSRNPGTAATR
jgi:hypothetical protein